MMMEEGPSNGVHRRHRQRSSNRHDTSHAASSQADDASTSSDDSKKIRYNKRRLLARLRPSRGTVVSSAVLVIGTIIVYLIFIDDLPVQSSLRGKAGTRLAKEMDRWERRRRKQVVPRSHDDETKRTEPEVMGALNYGGGKPQVSRKNTAKTKGLDTATRGNTKDEAKLVEDVKGTASDGDRDEGGKELDKEKKKEGEVVVMDNTTNETEAEEEIRGSEHSYIVNYTWVDVYNTSLPENKELACDLGSASPAYVADKMLARISANLEERIEKTFEKAKTAECRAKVGESFAHFVRAIGEEKPLPFEDVKFTNGCFFPQADVVENGEEVDPDEEQRLFDEAEAASWSYRPPRNESKYIDKPENLNILYAILTHGQSSETIRLINTLYEYGHTFVIHVDGKEIADKTQRELLDFASSRSYVHVLPDRYRVRVNWGGFSMVNATLQVMRYAMAVDRLDAEPMDFHKFVHMSATAYPIKSNKRIRQTLSEYPIDANHHWVLNKPTTPHEEAWHFFVECDDAVHRIFRLPPKRWENSGIDIMTSSQWFISSREFIQYLAEAKPGTFVHEYLQYTEHVVVADEQFFGTILRHTEFCHKHDNSNLLFLEFGEWENFMHNDTSTRDARKCLMPDPERCGRSPKEITRERVMALDLEEKPDLFARKFAHREPDVVKDTVDKYLRDDGLPRADLSFAGKGVLIVAKETVNNEVPLCLGHSADVNSTLMHLKPCFSQAASRERNDGWYENGVHLKHVPQDNRFHIGRCSSDGNLSRVSNGEITVTPGNDNPAGPRCFIKMNRNNSAECLQSISNSSNALGFLESTIDCRGAWMRTFFFGDGKYAPRSSLHLMVSSSLRKKLAGKEKGHKVEAHICLAVEGEAVAGPDSKGNNSTNNNTSEVVAAMGLLEEHVGKRIITTQCSKNEQVIEWIFVPCIGEDNNIGHSDKKLRV